VTRDDIGLARMANGEAISLKAIPAIKPDELAHKVDEAIALGLRVSAYFGAPAAARAGDAIDLYALLADDERNTLYVGRARVEPSTAGAASFPSIARERPQVQLFEREIAEQFGLVPEGHPWLKPVRYPRSPEAPAVGDFYRVEGESVHEVAVGPVHAGVIEPGHFRFQCHGERVLHLEIALGYQRRGAEEALSSGPNARSIRYAETVSGDATIAHATSYCQLLEALSGQAAPARAQAIRVIALELERLACHIGDLGALAGDVGFLPTASYCGRIRGDFLNMTALLCGNRFGRGLVVPGGVAWDLDDERAAELLRRLEAGERDARSAIDLLFDTQSVLARFEDTGRLDREAAIALGAVGPAARASGLSRDVRFDQSSGLYRLAQIPVSTYDSGDVLGRAFVRKLEIGQSIAFIREQLCCLPEGAAAAGSAAGSRRALGALAPNAFAVALNEGWRGETCHVAITGAKGQFARCKIVDPSFHNWPALAYVLRDQEISDFPICNKSFNLSYCGHDL
jgi:Ni,Fe-hydrogenase III large subunit